MKKIKKRYETPLMAEVRMAGRDAVCMERSHLLANSGNEVYTKKRGRSEEEENHQERESLW